jgi:hypothetical protein
MLLVSRRYRTEYDELEGIWKEEVIALSWHFYAGIKENHENRPFSRIPAGIRTEYISRGTCSVESMSRPINCLPKEPQIAEIALFNPWSDRQWNVREVFLKKVTYFSKFSYHMKFQHPALEY